MDYKNAYHIFPSEIWEVVVDKINDSEDILNFFKVCPELGCISNGNHFSWFIGELIPLIFPKFLKVCDMKSCRLVSKTWKSAIENTLETHPDRWPYKSSKLTRITETHIQYHKLPYIVTNFCKFFRSESLLCLERSGVPENPFPGRYVHFTIDDYQDEVGILARKYIFHLTKTKVRLCEALPVLQIYGHHIWHMTFDFNSEFPEQSREILLKKFVQCLFRCLAYLPNLKSLKLRAFNFTGCILKDIDRLELLDIIEAASFPFQLETLNLIEFHEQYWDLHKSFVTVFLKHKSVRKFSISDANWVKDFGVLLPNLRELFISIYEKKALQIIVKDLKSVPLGKLTIVTGELSLNEVLQIISFKKIESLEFWSFKKVSARSALWKSFTSLLPNFQDNNGLPVGSLKSLRIEETTELNFKFLELVPCLQFLSIRLKYEVWDRLFRGELNAQQEKYGLLLYLRNFYTAREKDGCIGFNRIWNEFPNLQVITINVIDRFSHTFLREMRNEKIVTFF